MNKIFQTMVTLVVAIIAQAFMSTVVIGFQEDSGIRELYVPFSDLNLILEADPNRVYLTREEYDELLAAAEIAPIKSTPANVLLKDASYVGKLAAGRLEVEAALVVDVLNDRGPYLLPITIGGFGIRSGKMDEGMAPLTRDQEGRVSLILREEGEHKVDLSLVAASKVDAAQQRVEFTLPTDTSTRFSIAVSGNVDLLSGAAVVSKNYDEGLDETQFDLVLPGPEVTLAFTLNNRQVQNSLSISSQSVLVSEVTQGYERLHATVSYRIWQGATDVFTLTIPEGFEVTEVETPFLARWEQQKVEGGEARLRIEMREKQTGRVLVKFTANRSPKLGVDWLASLRSWQFPKAVPLDTQNAVYILGLVAEERLQVRGFQTNGLLSLDGGVLEQAIPASVLAAAPGAPAIRQISAYYSPESDFSFVADVFQPEKEIQVASSQILLVSNEGLQLSGTLVVSPTAEELYDVQLKSPTAWELTSVVTDAGAVLDFEKRETEAGYSRYSVRLPRGVGAGESARLEFLMMTVPSEWLQEWQEQPLTFPTIEVVGATRAGGAIIVQTADDIDVTALATKGLVPVLEREKPELGIAGLPADLAFRHETLEYDLSLNATRQKPSVSARALSFIKIGLGNLAASYAIEYDIKTAKTSQLSFMLPLSSPLELNVVTYPLNTVAELTKEERDDARIWTVKLRQPQMGRVTLAVNFRKSLETEKNESIDLPVIRIPDLELQSGLFSIEGDPELDIDVSTNARKVDVGEMTSDTYAIGRRLVGAFSFLGPTVDASVNVSKRTNFGLPSALIHRSELVAQVSEKGTIQTVVRYDFVSKASLLEIALPQNSTLWTIFLDGEPTKPQRDNGNLLLGLPSDKAASLRRLQIVYETASRPIGLLGEIEMTAPTIAVRSLDDGGQRVVPEAELRWTVRLPAGHRIRWSSGAANDQTSYQSPLSIWKLAGLVGGALGGTRVNRWTARIAQNESMQTDSALIIDMDDAEFEDSMPSAAFQEMKAESFIESDLERDKSLNRGRPADAITETPAPPSGATAEAAQSYDQPETVEGGEEPPRQKQEENTIERVDKLWALEGMSSLEIDLNSTSGFEAQFSNLGENRGLAVGTLNQNRMKILAAASGLFSLLIGLAIWRKPFNVRVRFIVFLFILGQAPLLLFPSLGEMGLLFDAVFLAGFGLIPVYMVLGLLGWSSKTFKTLACRCCSTPSRVTGSTLLAFILLIGIDSRSLQSQEKDPVPVDVQSLKALLSTIEGPVTIPKDAIIVPYDPETAPKKNANQKILVPFDEYQRLWKASQINKGKQKVPSPIGIGVSHATYRCSLGEGDSLTVTGRLDVSSYREGRQVLSFEMGNAVIVSARLNEAPARLKISETSAPENNVQAAKGDASPQANIYDLVIEGQGDFRFEFVAEVGIESQGAWSIVNCLLPHAASQEVQISIPKAQTEILQQGLTDVSRYESDREEDRWTTALSSDGRLRLRWRTKLRTGQIDQSLTARSYGVFDVREDALRMTWQANLDFGRSTRDTFSFDVPADYRVESVVGENVRGFTTRQEADRQSVDIVLLKAVEGTEQVTLSLSQNRSMKDMEETISVPVVLIRDAALESGELMVRRSPRLDLQIALADGINRYEENEALSRVKNQADLIDAAILTPLPFQVFRFVKPPYVLQLDSKRFESNPDAEIRAALRIGTNEITLDSSINVRPEGAPVYQVEMVFPSTLVPVRVGNGVQEWTLEDIGDSKKLSVRFLNGQTEPFEVPVLFQLPQNDTELIEVPKLEIQNARTQTGTIVIVPEPDVEVKFQNIENCQSSLLKQGPPWMLPEQRSLTKASIRFSGSNYQASVSLERRKSNVSSRTISNVLVTSTSVKETVLVDLEIRDAGIRSVSLIIPNYLSEGIVNAKLLKSQKLSDVLTDDGQVVTGWKRLNLELQDDVRGRYALLVEKDRLLEEKGQVVQVPYVEGTEKGQRFVALENTGRDELLVEEASLRGLTEVGPQETRWKELTSVLGESISSAFVTDNSTSFPELSIQTLKREQVERAGARIGLAQTTLVVDEQGGYRAHVEFRMTNADEPFLELQLPEGAQLWTVRVAGEPGKAISSEAEVDGQVRIPLVKTGEGEGDYAVEVKYGGAINLKVNGGITVFPLVRSNNINIELSQVRLHLPESMNWFDFNGTMRLVESDSALAEGFQSYLNKRIQEAAQAIASGSNEYSKVRAAVNLSQSRQLFEDNRRNFFGSSSDIDQWYLQNDKLLQDAEEQVQNELDRAAEAILDNRTRLNRAWAEQRVERSNNLIRGSSSNFEGAYENLKESRGDLNYNSDFFEQNQLKTRSPRGENDPVSPEKDEEAGLGRLRKIDRKPVSGANRGYESELQSAQTNRFNQQQQIELGVKNDPFGGQQSMDLGRKSLPKLQQYRDQLERTQRADTQDPDAVNGRLQEPSVTAPTTGGLPGGFGGPMGGGGIALVDGQVSKPNQGPASPTANFDDGQAAWENVDSGFASLDVKLSERGRVYRFTTPRGEMEITARAIPKNLGDRSSKLLQLFLLVSMICLLTSRRAMRLFQRATGTWLFIAFAILGGIISLVLGIFPILGLIMLLGGVLASLKKRLLRGEASATAA